MPVKPIRPEDLAEQLAKTVPDAVIEAWNETIAEHFDRGTSQFKQNELVGAICEAMQCNRQKVLDQGWLNLEPLFEKAGWSVDYDKPGYNESYEPSFTFTRKSK